MHIRFAEQDESFIKAEIEGGFYTNETELVRDAVRHMREEKERHRRLQFQEAVARGVASVECGQTVELTPALLQDIKREGIRKAQNGEPYHSANAIPS